jgi:hypothetical protein
MIARKNEFGLGLGLMIGFVVVLILIFSPVFEGKNGLDYLDNLYNSISKGSAYYIPEVKEKSDAFTGTAVHVTLTLEDQVQAQETGPLFQAGGAQVMVTENRLEVAGDLGKILENALGDADAMYHNQGDKISGKYGYEEKRGLFHWWKAFNALERELKKQKKFKEADMVANVSKKAIETAYNYYEIEPQGILDRLGIVIFSLVFYVIYTLWYGFAIMFMFEGWGMKLEH